MTEPSRTVNNLDAIKALSFDMLSGPEAGEQIRDSLIAEIVWLRSDLDAALARAVPDGHTRIDGTVYRWVEINASHTELDEATWDTGVIGMLVPADTEEKP